MNHQPYQRYPTTPRRIVEPNGFRPPRKSGKGPKIAAITVLCACVAMSGAIGVYVGQRTLPQQQTPTAQSETVPLSTPVEVQPETTTTLVDSSGLRDVSTVAQLASNSVVEIYTQVIASNQRSQQIVGSGAGSGVILSADGYVVTNNHVIEGATDISVRTSDMQTYEATLIGRDPQTDLALLKIDAQGLQSAVLGDSDALVVGEPAIAIGNPLGTLGGTVTDGIISALGRELQLDEEMRNLLQTNAAINPGNSGGGLFNENGELIGIVVAKSGGTNIEGLGFAIPVNDMKSVVQELMDNGYVSGRATIGVSLLDISDAQTAMQYRVSQTGVYLSEVQSSSQAAQVGLQAGDRVISLNGTEITSASQAKEIIYSAGIGSAIEIIVERGGQTGSATLTVAEEVTTA